MNPRIPYLRQKAGELPETPGVYLMKDEKGGILYVGKSKKLKNRVISYFVGDNHTRKTRRLIEKIFDFETILCDSEMEALSLENNLIKKHTPKYNIRLKDAKSYPYIKITAGEYPRLLVTRDRVRDGGKYYGPYTGMSVAYDVVDTVRRVFGLPSCKRDFPKDIGKERPCLYYEMGRCIAPCTGRVTGAEYQRIMKEVSAVLDGDYRAAMEALKADMQTAAEEERYEEAARFRDSMRSLERLREKQKVVADETEDHDVFAFYSDTIIGVAVVFNVRGGKLLGQASFLFSDDAIWEEDGGIGFIAAHYADGGNIPKEVHLACDASDEDMLLLSEELTRLRGTKVTVRAPKRGDARKLCDLALTNAAERADEYRREREKEDANLVLLTSMLGLPVVPDRIEAYDISNIGDEFITASMVVFEGGKPKKSDYRTFRVRRGEGRDDYASMSEALMRRLSHIGTDESSLGTAPDLILLDGGKGQVSAVREVMRDFPFEIPLFGMVKDDFHKTRSLSDGENEIGIVKEAGVYALIYRIQEEAHRVAYSRSQNAKRKTLKHSSLEGIPGIGPAKADLLLRVFESYKRLCEAEEAEIAATRGIRPAEAAAVYRYLHPEKETKT